MVAAVDCLDLSLVLVLDNDIFNHHQHYLIYDVL